jgi:hypothetical protein
MHRKCGRNNISSIQQYKQATSKSPVYNSVKKRKIKASKPEEKKQTRVKLF